VGNNRVRCFLWLCLMLLIVAVGVQAQSTNAEITGQVNDPTKAVVPGASVTAVNNLTNVKHAVTTNQSGIYVITNLPPGEYRVEIEKKGFRSIVKPEIVLHVQDRIELNFEMAVGATSETVTVEGGAPLVNTESASVGTVIDRQFVENMPLNGRTFQSLISLTPGVMLARGAGTQGGFSVDGQRTDANTFIVDGVNANVGANLAGGGNLSASGNFATLTAAGTTQSIASIDALQEFKVQTSTYSAEYGTRPGGQIVVVTRSGTNQYHGSGFEFVRNTVFDANDWFANRANVPRSPEHHNDFGGTLGGPVWIPHVYNGRDKTFFFFSYEGLRLLQPGFLLTNVPDACLRGTAPASGAGSCASVNAQFNNTGANVLSPAAAALRPILNAFPLSNGQELGNGMAEFSAGFSNPNNIDTTSIRIDHTVNSKLTVFGRYSQSPSVQISFGNSLASQTVNELRNWSTTAGATWTITPRMANDLRVNWTANGSFASQTLNNFGGATPPPRGALIPAEFDPGAGAQGGINLLFTSRTSSGTNFYQLQDDYTNNNNQFNIVDGFSFAVGSHRLKFGVDYRRLTPDIAVNRYTIFAQFNNAAQLIAGVAPSASITGSAARFPLFQNFSLYGQDTWKVTRRLSLDFGLRWDVNPAPSELSGKSAIAIAGNAKNLASLTLASPGTPQWQTTYKNFAPRIGAAYQLFRKPGLDTVLRGGFGVFYDVGNNAAGQALSFPYSFTKNVTNLVYPYSSAQVAPLALPVTPTPRYPNFFAFNPELQLPYTLQWNFALEQSLGKDQTVTATYVGNSGKRLLQQMSRSLTALNPNFGALTLTDNMALSRYSALQAQYRRRLSHGLQVLTGYTWAHALDNFDTTGLQGNLLGNSPFDIRHTFTTALSYAIPTPGNNPIVKAVIGHWSIDTNLQARTGPPLDITAGLLTNPTTGEQVFARASIVPGIPEYISGRPCNPPSATGPLSANTTCAGGTQLNFTPGLITAAQAAAVGCQAPTATNNKGPFCTPLTGTTGNLGRNQVRSQGAWQDDLAVQREFPIRESLSFLFRVEAFNVFNHPNFGAPNATIGNANFGQATAMLGQGLGGGLNPVFQVGGPRSLQFVAKLKF